VVDSPPPKKILSILCILLRQTRLSLPLSRDSGWDRIAIGIRIRVKQVKEA